MNNRVPRTPFSTHLSKSAKETEIRIRNIFSGPKKRPPFLFLALMFSACILCGNLVSCQMAEAEQASPDASQQEAEALAQKDPVRLSAQDLHPDLNHNGIPEEVRLVKHEEYTGDPWNVEFWENGERFLWKRPDICLCTLDGTDYILRYNIYEYQGVFDYYYELAYFDDEFEQTQQWNAVRFDTNFNTLFHKSFDPEEIAAFVAEVNELLEHSVRLSNVDGELVVEECQPEDLPWLDNFPDIFTRDPNKSLLENLKAFQAAMPQDLEPPVPAIELKLPFDQPIDLEFCSGAGAWRTVLTLHSDGTFQGDYEDADMEVRYVCQFHGRFGDMVQLTDNSWYLVLKELELDTKYPVSTEWDEKPFHFISSQPYGFDGADGKALQPGARFIFYLPGATGHAPGTELYGAYDFRTWWPNRHAFHSASDTLGCYGLQNLETGYGFFSVNYSTSPVER